MNNKTRIINTWRNFQVNCYLHFLFLAVAFKSYKKELIHNQHAKIILTLRLVVFVAMFEPHFKLFTILRPLNLRTLAKTQYN